MKQVPSGMMTIIIIMKMMMMMIIMINTKGQCFSWNLGSVVEQRSDALWLGINPHSSTSTSMVILINACSASRLLPCIIPVGSVHQVAYFTNDFIPTHEHL